MKSDDRAVPPARAARPGEGVPKPGVFDYQVGPEAWVELDVKVYDAEGEQVLAPEERHAFVCGFGQILPGIERALEGAVAGEKRCFELAAQQAYGDRDEALVLGVDRSEFPEQVRPGDRFEVEDAEGSMLVLRVLDVGKDEVQVDLNHPLAGQKVRFEVETLNVRPATSAEIAAAERALAQIGAQTTPLLAPESLLRGSGRRYEEPAAPALKNHEPKKGSVTEEKKA